MATVAVKLFLCIDLLFTGEGEGEGEGEGGGEGEGEGKVMGGDGTEVGVEGFRV